MKLLAFIFEQPSYMYTRDSEARQRRNNQIFLEIPESLAEDPAIVLPGFMSDKLDFFRL